MKQYFCIGTYTEAILFGTGEVFQGTGKGISIYSLENGKIEMISSIGVRNPSYLCLDENRKKIYAVNELKEYMDSYGGGVTQISYDDNGDMMIEKTGNIRGTDPCHILLSPNGQFLSVANFASGSITIVPLKWNGDIEIEHVQLFQHEGSSSHPIRQNGPHAHATIAIPGESMLYVPDLGTDSLYAYRYNGKQVVPDDSEKISIPAGSGPRTGVFSENKKDFYLIFEISSQIIHFRRENGGWVEKVTVNTLPDDSIADNICSDIHLTPNGFYLYASNRGHDSLVCYRVCEDGSLEFLERRSCHGKTPRNFAIDPNGKYLLCGNQESDTISIFEISENGGLDFIRVQSCETPVCIRFFHEKQA